jgi:sporulation protein YlmC with PRC-barrel domain
VQEQACVKKFSVVYGKVVYGNRAGNSAGRVSDLHFTISHRQPKLIAIHKQSDDDVMHLD